MSKVRGLHVRQLDTIWAMTYLSGRRTNKTLIVKCSGISIARSRSLLGIKSSGTERSICLSLGLMSLSWISLRLVRNLRRSHRRLIETSTGVIRWLYLSTRVNRRLHLFHTSGASNTMSFLCSEAAIVSTGVLLVTLIAAITHSMDRIE